MRGKTSAILAALVVAGSLVASAVRAEPDPVGELANAICAGKTAADIGTSLVDVGAGTKWASPIRRRDVETLVSSEPDIARAFYKGGWKHAALVL